jgi:hypothetical protein
MVGRRQSSGERVFTQILVKVLKFRLGKSYPVSRYRGHVLSRPVIGSGDFFRNCLWNIGGSKAIEIDFCFPDDKLAVEVDGGYHVYLDQVRKDFQRDCMLRDSGWTIIRIPDKCINNTLSWMLVDKNYILS